MKHNIPTCEHPNCPKEIYFRNMYKTFFYGGFKNRDEVVAALDILDEVSPDWDYEPFCLIYGANPLPEDYVFGFSFVDETTRDYIYDNRKKYRN